MACSVAPPRAVHGPQRQRSAVQQCRHPWQCGRMRRWAGTVPWQSAPLAPPPVPLAAAARPPVFCPLQPKRSRVQALPGLFLADGTDFSFEGLAVRALTAEGSAAWGAAGWQCRSMPHVQHPVCMVPAAVSLCSSAVCSAAELPDNMANRAADLLLTHYQRQHPLPPSHLQSLGINQEIVVLASVAFSTFSLAVNFWGGARH